MSHVATKKESPWNMRRSVMIQKFVIFDYRVNLYILRLLQHHWLITEAKSLVTLVPFHYTDSIKGRMGWGAPLHRLMKTKDQLKKPFNKPLLEITRNY